jgi:hypothetical protein
MTLTVQDLVTKFDDFADDAKVKVKRFILSEGTSITRNIVDIKKDGDGNVVLVTELVSIQHDDHEEPKDEESEDEGIVTNLRGDEDEKSEGEE